MYVSIKYVVCEETIPLSCNTLHWFGMVGDDMVDDRITIDTSIDLSDLGSLKKKIFTVSQTASVCALCFIYFLFLLTLRTLLRIDCNCVINY